MMLQLDRKADSLRTLSQQLVAMPIGLSCLLILASPFAARAGLADQTQFGAGAVAALLLQSVVAWIALQRHVQRPLHRLVEYLREVRQGRETIRPPEAAGALSDVVELIRDIVQTQIKAAHYVVNIHAIDEVTQAFRNVARTAKSELTGIAHSTTRLVEELNQNRGQLAQAFSDIHKSLDSEADRLGRLRHANTSEVEAARIAPAMFDEAVTRFEERANTVLKSVGRERLVGELETLTRAVTAAGVDAKENGIGLAEVRSSVNTLIGNLRPASAMSDRLKEISENIAHLRLNSGARESEAITALAAEIKLSLVEMRERNVAELSRIGSHMAASATRDDLVAVNTAIRQMAGNLTDAIRDIEGRVASQAASAVEVGAERSRSALVGIVEPVLDEISAISARVEPLQERLALVSGSVGLLPTTAGLDARFAELERLLQEQGTNSEPRGESAAIAEMCMLLSQVGSQLDVIRRKSEADIAVVDSLQDLRESIAERHASLASVIDHAQRSQSEGASSSNAAMAGIMRDIEAMLSSLDQRTAALSVSMVDTLEQLRRQSGTGPAIIDHLTEAHDTLLSRIVRAKATADQEIRSGVQNVEHALQSLDSRLESLDGAMHAMRGKESQPGADEMQSEAVGRLRGIAEDLALLKLQSTAANESIGLIGQQLARSVDIHERAISEMIGDSNARFERLSERSLETRKESETLFLDVLSRIESGLSSVASGLKALDASSREIGQSADDSRAAVDRLEIGPNFEKVLDRIAQLSRDVQSTSGGVEQANHQLQQAMSAQDVATAATRASIVEIGQQLASMQTESTRIVELRLDSLNQELGDHIVDALRKLTAMTTDLENQSGMIDRLSSSGQEPVLSAIDGIRQRLGELSDQLAQDARIDATRSRLDGVEQMLGKVTELLSLVERHTSMTNEGVGLVASDVKRVVVQQGALALSLGNETRRLDERTTSLLGEHRAMIQGELSRGLTVLQDNAERFDRRFAAVEELACSMDSPQAVMQVEQDAARVMSRLDEICGLLSRIQQWSGEQAGRMTESLSRHGDLQRQSADEMKQRIGELHVWMRAASIEHRDEQERRIRAMTGAVEDALSRHAALLTSEMSAVTDGVQRQGDESGNRLMNAILSIKAAMSEYSAAAASVAPSIKKDIEAALDGVRDRLDLALDRLEDRSPAELRGKVESDLRDQSLQSARLDHVIETLQAMHRLVEDIAHGSTAFDGMSSVLRPLSDGLLSLRSDQASMLSGISMQLADMSGALAGLPDALAGQVQNLPTRGDMSRLDVRLDELAASIARMTSWLPEPRSPIPYDSAAGSGRAITVYPSLRDVAMTDDGDGPPLMTAGGTLASTRRFDDLLDRVEESSELFHHGMAELRSLLSRSLAESQSGLAGLRADVGRHLTDLATSLELLRADDRVSKIESSIFAGVRQVAEIREHAAQLTQAGVREVMAGIRGIALNSGDSAEILHALGDLQRTIGDILDDRTDAIRRRQPEPMQQTSEVLRHTIGLAARLDEIVARLDRIYDGLDSGVPVWPPTSRALPSIEADLDPASEKIRQLAQFADLALTRMQGMLVATGDAMRRDEARGPLIESPSNDSVAVLDRVSALEQTLRRMSDRIEELLGLHRSDDINAAIAETLLEFEGRMESPLNAIKEDLASFRQWLDSRSVPAAAGSEPIEDGAMFRESQSPSMTTVLKLMGGFTAAIEDRFSALERLIASDGSPQGDPDESALGDELAEMRKLTEEFLDISSAISSELSSYLAGKARDKAPRAEMGGTDGRRVRR